VSRAARCGMDDVGFADRIDSVDSAITKGATGSRGNNIITTVPGTFTEITSISDLQIFLGRLYASVAYSSAELWRSSDGTSWEQVNDGGFAGTDIHLATFGNYLYAFAYPSGLIYRSSNGMNWSVAANLQSVAEDISNLGGYLKSAGEHLFAGTVKSHFTTNDGCEIWKSSNGTSWLKSVADGFEDSDNRFISDMEVFQGALYAAIGGLDPGGELWRTAVSESSLFSDGFECGSTYYWSYRIGIVCAGDDCQPGELCLPYATGGQPFGAPMCTDRPCHNNVELGPFSCDEGFVCDFGFGCVPDPAASCVASGGTVLQFECCGNEFANTCLIGTCGCAPGTTPPLDQCSCPPGYCFNGSTCTN
jgi:hypothetical protein